MEQHDFETEFRRLLKEREIKPSEGSWEKLSYKLDAGEKKGRSRFWRAGIAASLAAGVAVSSLLFSKGAGEQENQVVGGPEEDRIEIAVPHKVPEEVVVTKEVGERSNRDRIGEKNEIPVPVQRSPIVKAPAIAEVNDGLTKPIEEETVDPGISKVANEETAFAVTTPSEEKSIGVTDEEIESLLRKADLKLSGRDSGEIAKGIRAEDLLLEVETELEQSFRRKVLEVLQEGFSKARTAVVNRRQ